MNFPRSCRVVVIDDTPEEAQPVIEALGKLGAGCIYLRGNKLEDLPEKPIPGVRLVVLDMRLDAGLGDQEVMTTATVFSRVVSAEEGPLVVLLWTKHEEDVDEFRTALFNTNEKFRSMLLIGNLEKPLKMSDQDAQRTVKKLQKLAKQWAPMNVVWHWEQLAHDAASATTVLVSEQVTDSVTIDAADSDEARRRKWLARLTAVLRALAMAAGGHAGTAKSAHEDLLETFLALHGDRMEHALSESEKADLAGLFSEAPAAISAKHAAKLNSMLLLAGPTGEPGELRPGNAYFRKAGAVRNVLYKRTGFNARQLAKEVLKNLPADDTYKQRARDATPAKDAPKTAAHKAAARLRNARATELYEMCLPMLVELSPPCDFSQNKRCVVRFAGGLLVPVELEKVVSGATESLRVIRHRIQIPGRAGDWFAVFSGRHHYAIAISKALKVTRPQFRFRSQFMGDIRNWYAAQSARLGYLSV